MILQQAKNTLKKILPEKVKLKLNSIAFDVKLRQVRLDHQKALKKVRKKDKIKVAFFVIHGSVWKYEGVYRLMEQDERFEPIIVVCPYISMGEVTMLYEMNLAYNNLKNNGHNIIKTYNEESGKWLDVKKDIKPDIVCFTNPWNLTRPEYLISNYLDTLTCYVPYGFKNSYLYQAHFNQPMQNFVWKFFLETEIHHKLSKQYARNKGINNLVSGYPGMDKFLNKDYQPVDAWKIKDKNVKRIIWAPHHTISGMGATLDYSTFLTYSDFMLEIANKYKDNIQIAFKPHPILRSKLSKEEVWGKEKADEYYKKWADLPNGQLNEGEYIDIFLTSDGMIHDSSSFVIEYLYTNKPVMFLINDDSVFDKFNEIGKMALSKLYHGKSRENIERFLNEVIINNRDFMQSERILFFNTVVKPPNNVTASENIFSHLKSVLLS